MVRFLPLHLVEIDLQGPQLVPQRSATDPEASRSLQLISLRVPQHKHQQVMVGHQCRLFIQILGVFLQTVGDELVPFREIKRPIGSLDG